MHIVTNGRNIDLTEAIKAYVVQKMSRLGNHFDFVQEVHVILEVEKNPRISDNQLAEVTVHVPGAIIRVEAASNSLYASIDKLVDKTERSLRKYKTKLQNRPGNVKHGDTIRKESVTEPDLDGPVFEGDEDEIILNVQLDSDEEEGIAFVESKKL